MEISPSLGLASLGETILKLWVLPLPRSVTSTVGAVAHVVAGGALDHHGRAHLLAQPQDARLQVGLGLLGGVVLAVLLEVAPLARGLDARGDTARARRSRAR